VIGFYHVERLRIGDAGLEVDVRVLRPSSQRFRGGRRVERVPHQLAVEGRIESTGQREGIHRDIARSRRRQIHRPRQNP
jgi:hypothetical protein